MRLKIRGLFVTVTALLSIVVTTGMTPTPSPVPSPAPASASVKNKTTEFSTRTDVHACTEPANESCSIDTFVMAKALSNGELKWERRIYFRKYQASAGTQPPVIAVKSIKLSGKTLQVTNDRGDTFKIETQHGHLKSPKESKEYLK